MRLLANENIPLEAVRVLRERGHDVLWIRTETPGIADTEVIARATMEKRSRSSAFACDRSDGGWFPSSPQAFV